jgi:hypothetical protein
MGNTILNMLSVPLNLIFLQSSNFSEYLSNMTFLDYFNALVVLLIVLGFFIGIGSIIVDRK